MHKMEITNEGDSKPEPSERNPLKYGDFIQGQIIKLDRKKGFGFIISPDRKFVRFFFHWLALEQTTKNFKELEEGMKVKFLEAYGDKGARAVQIRVLDDCSDDSMEVNHV